MKQIYMSQQVNKKSEHTQYLVLIDENEDLYIRPVPTRIHNQILEEESCSTSFKLGTHVKSAAWDENCNILCCLEGSKAVIFYFPEAPFVDIDLLEQTRETLELGQSTKCCAKVETMTTNRCVVSLQNKSIIHVPVITEGYSLLREFASVGAWEKCIRLCRFKNKPAMWAVLALEGIQQDQLEVTEACLVAVRAVEKLEHLHFIRSMPKGEVCLTIFNLLSC